MQASVSPVTGILAEEQVVIDFGEFQGKSVFQISEDHPDFYQFLIDKKDEGNFFIKRSEHKEFLLYVHIGPAQ